jgi:hypothetical protein
MTTPSLAVTHTDPEYRMDHEIAVVAAVEAFTSALGTKSRLSQDDPEGVRRLALKLRLPAEPSGKGWRCDPRDGCASVTSAEPSHVSRMSSGSSRHRQAHRRCSTPEEYARRAEIEVMRVPQ